MVVVDSFSSVELVIVVVNRLYINTLCYSADAPRDPNSNLI